MCSGLFPRVVEHDIFSFVAKKVEKNHKKNVATFLTIS